MLYHKCCTCGNEMNREFKTCESCYQKYKSGYLYHNCMRCGCHFDKPSLYGTCCNCYYKYLKINDEIENS